MTQARFVVSLAEGTWLYDVSAAFPDATLRVLAALENDAGGVGLCCLVAPDTGDVLASVGEHDDVALVTVFEETPTEGAFHFETNDTHLVVPALDTGVLIEFPVEVADGRAVIDVVGEPSRITDFGARLETLHPQLSIEFVREYTPMDEQLTQKQRSLVETAVELGYYDTPRRCSLTDLAAEIGLAKSTVSETLHRAEEVVIRSFLKTADAHATHQTQ